MTEYRTKSGKVMTEADFEALAAEAATDEFAEEAIETIRQREIAHGMPPDMWLGDWLAQSGSARSRPVGRPRMGTEPAEVTAIRLDPELRAALDQAAQRADVTVSEVVRRALREYLKAS